MLLSLLGQVAFSALLVSASIPTPTKRANPGPLPSNTFVTAINNEFSFGGNKLEFVGTNAYWLSALNTEEDIDNTLGNISSLGISMVRTWAFNDVQTIPEKGTWFQLIGNGTTTINNGTNGLQKLDTVVRLAEKHGIFLQLSLTNNWNPLPLVDKTTTGIGMIARDSTPGTNNSFPRNTLSNDYGGMDVYVRALSRSHVHNHDDFYTDPTILDTFMNYTTQIVTRYLNSPAIFGWELANDARCNSSIPASSTCNTQTVTMWHSQVAQHIKSVDPNHLVASGTQGFFCVDCPKLFPRAPQPSPSASVRRRKAKPLTKKRLLQERRAAWKRSAASSEKRLEGRTIRGRWQAPITKRQFDQGVGPAFDGSSGVDSEDIINIPQIGYGSFQYFPDQNNYGPDDPSLPLFNNTVITGLNWINSQVNTALMSNKPVVGVAFGVVTQGNAANFVPFNSTQAPFDPPPTSTTAAAPTATATQPFGVTDAQRDDAYSQWLKAGLQGGLGGMSQYQWSQGNLTTEPGTAIQSASPGVAVTGASLGLGVSPNDGYGIQGQGLAGVQGVLQQTVQAFGT